MKILETQVSHLFLEALKQRSVNPADPLAQTESNPHLTFPTDPHQTLALLGAQFMILPLDQHAQVLGFVTYHFIILCNYKYLLFLDINHIKTYVTLQAYILKAFKLCQEPFMAGTLRITGGTLVRQRFNVPKEADENLVRPASDRVREAIFSSLGARLPNARVLDLFAGSGAYGFEAISRGAESVVFNELSRTTAQCVRENIAKLKLESCCRLVEGDALKFRSREPFDLVFVDPPYALTLRQTFWESLKSTLTAESLVIFRCKSQQDFSCPNGYEIMREKSYGGTWVVFLKKSCNRLWMKNQAEPWIDDPCSARNPKDY